MEPILIAKYAGAAIIFAALCCRKVTWAPLWFTLKLALAVHAFALVFLVRGNLLNFGVAWCGSALGGVIAYLILIGAIHFFTFSAAEDAAKKSRRHNVHG